MYINSKSFNQKLWIVQWEFLQVLKLCNENCLVFLHCGILRLNPSLMTVPETNIVNNTSKNSSPFSKFQTEVNFYYQIRNLIQTSMDFCKKNKTNFSMKWYILHPIMLIFTSSSIFSLTISSSSISSLLNSVFTTPSFPSQTQAVGGGTKYKCKNEESFLLNW